MSTASYLCDDVRDVGPVEGRESEALLAEVVQRCANMDQRHAVDYQEAVVEPVGDLDRQRVAVLRVEPRFTVACGSACGRMTRPCLQDGCCMRQEDSPRNRCWSIQM